MKNINLSEVLSNIIPSIVNITSSIWGKIIKPVAVILIGWVLMYQANPWGIFDSDEVKQFKKILATSQELKSHIEVKENEKRIASNQIESNNTRIEELKKEKLEKEQHMCGLDTQIGQKEIDLTKTCSTDELNQWKSKNK